MPDYSKGKIYTIRCRDDPSLIYVGSTTQVLSQQLGGHKRHTKRDDNMLLYQKINGNWDNWYIELYCDYPCDNKDQLCRKEGEVIREISTLNKRVEGRTNKEWYDDNKDKIKEKNKEYYEDKKDNILEKNKEYREQNKDKIKEQKKEYREQNKNKLKEKSKEYREQNKDTLKEYKSRKFTCECGCILNLNHKKRHEKSIFHQDYIKTLNQEEQ